MFVFVFPLYIDISFFLSLYFFACILVCFVVVFGFSLLSFFLSDFPSCVSQVTVNKHTLGRQVPGKHTRHDAAAYNFALSSLIFLPDNTLGFFAAIFNPVIKQGGQR